MRRKADREAPSQADIDRQQEAMRGVWRWFRVVIGVLVVCAAGAASVAFMLMNA